jgi:hypothetical protein
MHPQLLDQLAQQHVTEMRRSAARHRAAAAAAPAARRATIRNRAGWTLVQIGLRLASSADA